MKNAIRNVAHYARFSQIGSHMTVITLYYDNFNMSEILGRDEYLVLWKGYKKEEASWVTSNHITKIATE